MVSKLIVSVSMGNVAIENHANKFIDATICAGIDAIAKWTYTTAAKYVLRVAVLLQTNGIALPNFLLNATRTAHRQL